jgi:hypothetical protein
MKLNRRTLIGAGAAGMAAASLRGVSSLAAHGAPVAVPRSANPAVLQVATPSEGAFLGKEATADTRTANAAVPVALDFDNVNQLAGIDAVADATRGFIATRPELVVAAEDGREVWDLTAYDFLRRAGGTAHGQLQPVAAGPAQPEPWAFRGRRGRVSSTRLRPVQHDDRRG